MLVPVLQEYNKGNQVRNTNISFPQIYIIYCSSFFGIFTKLWSIICLNLFTNTEYCFTINIWIGYY